MNGLVKYLRTILLHEDKDSVNYRIAEYLMQLQDDIDDLSLTSIARECHVSKASVSRFCKDIGIDDFAELKYMIKQDSVTANEKYFYPCSNQLDFHSYFKQLNQQIEAFQSRFQVSQLEQLVEALHSHEKVYLMGISQSMLPGIMLQEDLSYFHKKVYCIDKIEEQRDILMHHDENSLIIVFSVSGTFFDHISLRSRAMERKHIPMICLITCNNDKPKGYIHDKILLDHTDAYSANILLFIYVQLIVLLYYRKFQENVL